MYRVGRWIVLGTLLSLAMVSWNLAKDGEAAPRHKSLAPPRSAKNAQAVERGSSPATFEIQEAKPVPAAQAGAPLTDETLQQMLDNLGYEPKESTSDSGAKSNNIKVERGTWTFSITITISPNKGFIWYAAFLGAVEKPDQTASAPLLNLLAKNNAIWPSYFEFVPAGKGLWLNRPLANAGVKPAAMRNGIEAFMSDIQNTGDDWDMSKWSAPAEAKPAASK